MVLFLILILMVSTGVLAAAHMPENSYATIDTWYTIDDKAPYICASYLSFQEADTARIGLGYYQNAQMFASLSSGNEYGQSATVIKGSYLTDFGLFIGLQNYSGDYYAGGVIISPGYRLSIGDNSYIAFSIDNDMPRNADIQYRKFDIDAKYLQENYRLSGYAHIPQADLANFEDPEYELYFVYKLTDQLTTGAELYSSDNSKITVGATYKGIRNLILDGMLGTNSGSSIYSLSGMYMIKNFEVGVEYKKDIMGDIIFYKAKYNTENSKFVLVYAPKPDYYSSLLALTYEMKL
jgi:hypothetical protein